MGKSESVNLSIGLKIKLGDLIEQINIENIEELKKIFSYGFIEDENNSFTSAFENIYYDLYNEFLIVKKKGVCKKKSKEQNEQNEQNEEKKDELAKNLEEENKRNKINEFKIKFIEESKKNGSKKEFKSSQFSGSVNTLEYGCLYDKFLLYPVKNLLSTSRWGNDREGTNSNSCELDFDIEKIKNDIKEKYNWIEGFKVVMMIKQHSC